MTLLFSLTSIWERSQTAGQVQKVENMADLDTKHVPMNVRTGRVAYTVSPLLCISLEQPTTTPLHFSLLTGLYWVVRGLPAGSMLRQGSTKPYFLSTKESLHEQHRPFQRYCLLKRSTALSGQKEEVELHLTNYAW